MSAVPMQAAKRPTIYLAGAIRDGVPADIEWRELVIRELAGQAVFLNPLGGKTYNTSTRSWDLAGLDPVASVIVPHDFWMVDRADILLVNLESMASGYPSIGTICEIGRATARDCLIYVIMSDISRVHPFIQHNAAAFFPDTAEAIRFLSQHLGVMSGTTPHFRGYVADVGIELV